ncbi:hypothetical protein RhiirA1_461334 [Rhizophagus irregularis]|uniref:Uncharacterized protein n=1 Tax=Rhizophagus irregularis TaxID=588596 RepID=A0A2N0RPJ2_9GLOM|nr:hypothetical protein RhiirA1_461334 [Rhizophagus irregularis]CAB4491563.1 unnamed protein product [Rhizophagus irregularis]
MIGMEKPAAMLYASSAQKPLVQSDPSQKTKGKLFQTVIKLLNNLEGRAIIYGGTVGECDDMTKALKKSYNSNTTGMYHGKLKSTEQTALSTNWKNGAIKIK